MEPAALPRQVVKEIYEPRSRRHVRLGMRERSHVLAGHEHALRRFHLAYPIGPYFLESLRFRNRLNRFLLLGEYFQCLGTVLLVGEFSSPFRYEIQNVHATGRLRCFIAPPAG